MAPLKTVFALFPDDEMRHPYERTLGTLGARVVWFSASETMEAADTPASPHCVLVDLDALPAPWEPELERLRNRFTGSDFIGISLQDSAQAALTCLRAGFADFLLKPLSPEELGWAVSKAFQRQELYWRLDEGKSLMVRAVNQISASTTPRLLRLCALEYVKRITRCERAAWVGREGKKFVSHCSLPEAFLKEPRSPAELWGKGGPSANRARPLAFRCAGGRTGLYLPCHNPDQGAVLLLDIPRKPSQRQLSEVRILVEHAEVCLLNLGKYEEVRRQTFVDDLTGLYNARYLKYALTTASQRSQRRKLPFAVLFIDVDRFKSINDEHGHLVGSDFLVAIGKTIRHAVRGVDPVFRYGGDEFVVILQDMPAEGARDIAERIRKHVERRIFLVKEHRLQTTVSVGIAIYPDHTSDRETLLRLADEAMYSAKRQSRNAVRMILLPAEARETAPTPPPAAPTTDVTP